VRHITVIDELARQLSGHTVLLIHLTLDNDIASTRGLAPTRRSSLESHSTERDVFSALPSRANLVVSVDRPLDQIVKSVVEFVQSSQC
jgi:hypothetical protein